MKTVFESIRYFDEVIIFDEDKLINLINSINPNLLIKDIDY